MEFQAKLLIAKPNNSNALILGGGKVNTDKREGREGKSHSTIRTLPPHSRQTPGR
jgi:hypothetical protein